jgi:phosphoglycerol transferase MdoB-like AlkP superfamily enzyme
MGFGAYARQTGIEKLYSRQDYEKKHGAEDFDGYWGVWDEKFLNYMGEELSEAKQPFFSTMFTLTSHHPFVIPERYAGKFPEGKSAVHKCVGYVDEAFRRFFARYENEEWFRNTVFVFVADHVSSEKFSDEARSPLGSSRIIQFFYTPDGALQGECTDVAQQIDIMPSLLALLGIDESYFAYGRNVFGDSTPLTFYWSTSAMRYVSTDGEWVVLFDGHSVTDLYSFSDKAMVMPLDKALYADVVADFEHRLRAVIQQYNLHLRRMDYTVPSGVE